MKKVLSILLSVLFVVTVVTPVFCLATEEESYVPPEIIDEYTLTSSIGASLSINGSTARATGIVGAKYPGASCSIKVTLQKKDSSGVWRGVKSWTNSGTTSVSAGGNYTVSSGSYRTCTTATITYNGESEYTFKYSATKTC